MSEARKSPRTLTWEVITRHVWSIYNICVWHPSAKAPTNEFIYDCNKDVVKLLEMFPSGAARDVLAAALLRGLRVAAVEVTDKETGQGVVVYADWP